MVARRHEAGSRGRRRSRLAVWWLHHRLAASATAARLREDAFGTLLVWLTLGVALALPLFLHLALVNLEAVGARWDGRPRVNVYFADDAPTDAARARAQAWGAWAEVESVRFLTPDAALVEYARAAGIEEPDLLLESNPLPAVAVVVPSNRALGAARVAALAERLGAAESVAEVQLDVAWVRRLQAGLAMLRRVGWGLAGLLGFGAVLVVGNLTRTAIDQRRQEIAVMRLMGGTDGFVLRPFLYQGAIFGLGGGAVACVLTLGVLAALGGPASELAAAYDARYVLRGPGPAGTLAVIAGAGALGVVGAWAAARRRLRAIEP